MDSWDRPPRPAAAAFEVYIIQMIEEARKAGNVAEAFSSVRRRLRDFFT